MMSSLRPALVLLVALTALTGLAYPAAVTATSALLLPDQAGGSPIRGAGAAGPVQGSRLIGQPFVSPQYVWGRPSATSAAPYDAAASSGSNLGPTNPALVEAVEARIAALEASDPANTQPIPVDLVTASASGLDPHVSPQAALWQVARIARARQRPEAEVRALVERHVEGRTLGVLGEPRVNVLELNLALDAAFGPEPARPDAAPPAAAHPEP